ncbi:MAG TPA: phosphotyrosine protein phosphatase [Vibrio sp.]|uniref:arsenate reductase/protein-tyrosine-phosphatase family protein n=1 Tax=Vibrio TaxID=662 RepID=UPI000EC65751|nr:low molecular weight phosphotyrosine protein phosphatase [Vibrio sp.]HCH02766.1 phosphotyrosine protein phosphatase [Vibrio sp.]
MFNKILVVCVGNICRSPTGERLLKKELPHKQIASAGIATEKSGLSGKPADETACTLAAEHHVSLDNHSAQQLTRELCRDYDLILVMEKGHIDAVSKIAPEVRGKTLLFGEWIGRKDIPDPYKKSREAFEYAFTLIEQASVAWAKRLK